MKPSSRPQNQQITGTDAENGEFKVFITGLSGLCNVSELLSFLRGKIAGVVSVSIPRKTKSGFAFVQLKDKATEERLLAMKTLTFKKRILAVKRYLGGNQLAKFKANVNKRRLFVYSIPLHTKDTQLYHLFSKFGEVENAYMIRDRKTRRATSYGYVLFRSQKVAEEVASLQKVPFKKKKLKVKMHDAGQGFSQDLAPADESMPRSGFSGKNTSRESQGRDNSGAKKSRNRNKRRKNPSHRAGKGKKSITGLSQSPQKMRRSDKNNKKNSKKTKNSKTKATKSLKKKRAAFSEKKVDLINKNFKRKRTVHIAESDHRQQNIVPLNKSPRQTELIEPQPAKIAGHPVDDYTYSNQRSRPLSYNQFEDRAPYHQGDDPRAARHDENPQMGLHTHTGPFGFGGNLELLEGEIDPDLNSKGMMESFHLHRPTSTNYHSMRTQVFKLRAKEIEYRNNIDVKTNPFMLKNRPIRRF